MEEELNENELEERLYSMLHYKDDTQVNSTVNQKDVEHIIENTPRSTVRRYWRTSEESSPYQKINTPKENPTNKNVTEKTDSKSKDEKRGVASPPQANLLSMFQSPVPQNLKRTIEIIENDEVDSHVVELESSDDDEVIEVALPPKPTITIESSDEDEVCAISKEAKGTAKDTTPGKKSPNEREVAASPVPSVVSSVSDEFIRGDCIALNISSRHSNNESFDFSLHGSDLLVQTPSKKKKKKKNKDCNTSTPIASPMGDVPVNDKQECFATPKSKAKNKRQKNKSYLVSEKSIPNPDVYDSDSNQSSGDLNKNASYTIPNKSNTNTDVNESDSNEPVIQNETNISNQTKTLNTDVPEKVLADHSDVALKATKGNDSVIETPDIVDLTGKSDHNTSLLSINENIVMGNVTGFSEPLSEPDFTEDVTIEGNNAPKLGSTNVPAILYADLDFNNLNGKEKPSKKRRYSVTTLRAEMEKFYNESWGGENFNHREIQKYMSRDKSLWVIDPKDRMSALSKRKVTCNYCNRPGHRDDTCRLKPPVCYMCGSIGHNEPRCPRKICVNCGSPNHMYSSMCRNCYNWHGITCAECGQPGHPSSHCPDLWRRYHNTISENMPLEENHQSKKHHQMFCSGCTRRGHLVHSCRITVPFSGLPINSPYVSFYNPVYPPTVNADETPGTTNQPNTNVRNNQDNTITSASTPHRTDRNKRQSKSPVVHETHLNKKRNLSVTETTDTRVNTKSPVNNGNKRKTSQSKDLVEDVEGSNKDGNKTDSKTVTEVEKAPDFIPIFSGNRDKQGQMIQDNEVSDTSDVVTSARIYVTSDIMDKLNKTDGLQWLNNTAEKNNVAVQKTDSNVFLIIKGTVGDQEAFQTELRNWINTKVNGECPKPDNVDDTTSGNDQALSNNIPKKRQNVLRIINKALESLKEDLGDPHALFKELNYLQNRHHHLLKQKIVNPKQLSNTRTSINSVFRKLNMVLLGQAGLADGPKHLNELCSLLEKITNFRQKILPPQLREEIGQHFHSIFTSTPREDYADLLSKYYVSKKTHVFSKNIRNERFNLNTKPKPSKNMYPAWQNNANAKSKPLSVADIANGMTPEVKKSRADKAIKKLAFYHRRLLHARPIDAVLKKTRFTLVQQLHDHIASLNRNTPYLSPKTLKKTRRIQEQAQLFLANV